MKYLALGDSYTIGEGVPFQKNFPHQVVDLLTRAGVQVNELSIIATTGWTTNELIGPMETQVKKDDYNWVTVLIGVNNQYRNQSVKEYSIHLQYILNRATYYANNMANHVIVISIPDWGLTPFNTDRDKAIVSAEIDAYNDVAQQLAIDNNMHFIDITSSTRANATNADYLSIDGLHPSEMEYAIWANKVAKLMLT
jgi:lysophospholipase L1-like esterase